MLRATIASAVGIIMLSAAVQVQAQSHDECINQCTTQRDSCNNSCTMAHNGCKRSADVQLGNCMAGAYASLQWCIWSGWEPDGCFQSYWWERDICHATYASDMESCNIGREFCFSSCQAGYEGCAQGCPQEELLASSDRTLGAATSMRGRSFSKPREIACDAVLPDLVASLSPLVFPVAKMVEWMLP